MVSPSKTAALNIKEFMLDILVGSRKKKIVSAAILVIIAFLIHVQNMKSGTAQLKLKPRNKDGKKVHQLALRKEAKATSMRSSCHAYANC
jgi:hypothetical protein